MQVGNVTDQTEDHDEYDQQQRALHHYRRLPHVTQLAPPARMRSSKKWLDLSYRDERQNCAHHQHRKGNYVRAMIRRHEGKNDGPACRMNRNPRGRCKNDQIAQQVGGADRR
jgi:hypothetical protein